MLWAVLLVWLGVTLPLALGSDTLLARDVFTTHLHLKSFGAQELAEGRVPYFNPTWGLGQPFRGNPNAVPLYPGNLLYLLVPFWSAFNLHYALHWLLAFLTMRALALRLGQSPAGALLSAMTYAGCGWMLTNLSFYNILTVVAWWPLVLIGVLRGDRRGLAIGAIACGLSLLGGDPITALLAIVPMALVAIARHGWLRGLLRCSAVGSLGLLLALPQIVASARIVGFSVRTTIGDVSQGFSLHPLRLIELLMPHPFGVPVELGPSQFLLGRLFDQAPFIFSIHIGLVALVLALVAARRHRAWALLAVSGLLAAWLAGPLKELTDNLFRYPDKFLVWFALASALLAGWGLDSARLHAAAMRLAIALAAACALLVVLMLWQGEALFRWLATAIDAMSLQAVVDHAVRSGALALLASGLLLAGIAWALRARQIHVLLILQLICLLRLYPLVPTAAVDSFREPSPWMIRAGEGTQVAMASMDSPFGSELPVYQMTETSRRTFARIGHLDLDFPTGVLHGLRYPIILEADALTSPLVTLVKRILPAVDWRARVNWMRVLGIRYVTMPYGFQPPGMTTVDVADRFGVPTSLLAVTSPAPPIWWPETVVTTGSATDAAHLVNQAADPIRVVGAPSTVAHTPGADIELLEESPDALRIAVSGDGGLLVVRRAYHPLWQASIDGRSLPIKPAQLALLGIEVPAGRHTIRVGVASTPDRLALFGIAIGGLCLIALYRRPGSAPSGATP